MAPGAARHQGSLRAMAEGSTRSANLKQTVPFFGVTDMEQSLQFYVEGLGFEIAHRWAPDGKVRWCWLQRGGAALMLQEFWREGPHPGRPDGVLGQGVTVCFMCEDALAIFHEAVSCGLDVARPFVGNALWVTSLRDPDGYRLDFESPTDVAEETVYEEPVS